jgi:hypothetical protein
MVATVAIEAGFRLEGMPEKDGVLAGTRQPGVEAAGGQPFIGLLAAWRHDRGYGRLETGTQLPMWWGQEPRV